MRIGVHELLISLVHVAAAMAVAGLAAGAQILDEVLATMTLWDDVVTSHHHELWNDVAFLRLVHANGVQVQHGL